MKSYECQGKFKDGRIEIPSEIKKKLKEGQKVKLIIFTKKENDSKNVNSVGESKSSKYMSSIKEEAKELINSMDEDSTWEDLIYEIYVKKKLNKGLSDIQEGKILSHIDVKKRFNE